MAERYKTPSGITEGMNSGIDFSLEEAPPELVGDIYDNGLLLTGGGALLGGLTQLIKRTLGINCNIAKDSINCVAKGTGMAFGRMTTLLDGFEAATVYKYR